MDDAAGDRRRLLGWCAEAHVPADEGYLAKMEVYWDLLDRWNRRVDLTGYRGRGAVLRGLLAPSLALAAVARLAHCVSVMDVGSGAGIPGVPLAVLYPDTTFRFVEPRERRALFLREAVRALHLRNGTVEAHRIEDLSVHRHDAVLSRAIDPVSVKDHVARNLTHGGTWWIQTAAGKVPPAEALLPWRMAAVERTDAFGARLLFLGLTIP